MKKIKIAVAGASGFVGRYLIEALIKRKYQVIALSRKKRTNENKPYLEWIQCDLFSRKDSQAALSGCDMAVYLTHSMIPSARLSQGTFSDYDLILSDNFSRAAKKNSLKKIIYLGGIVPDDQTISRHLMSRLEVEKTLKNSGVPLISLRAGIILGPEGSSFRMMYNLVKRLPIMICPSWTNTLSNPISIWDTITALLFCIEEHSNQSSHYDIGGKTTLSYVEMMKVLSKKAKLSKLFFSVPLFSPNLSKLWVRTVATAPKELVYPLVESLKTHMVPNINRQLPRELIKDFKTYDESLEKTLYESKSFKKLPRAFKESPQKNANEVCSVQRLETLYRFSAKDVSDIYFKWLNSSIPFLRVERPNKQIKIYNLGLKKPLLVLEKDYEISTDSYVVFFIKKGLLSSSTKRGRLVFRSVVSGRNTMVEIHEFIPRLPWFIYKYTQALFHLFTMKIFNSYLLKKQKNTIYEKI